MSIFNKPNVSTAIVAYISALVCGLKEEYAYYK